MGEITPKNEGNVGSHGSLASSLTPLFKVAQIFASQVFACDLARKGRSHQTSMNFKTPRGPSKTQSLTLPETNIAPENGWLEYWFPFGMADFSGAKS